MTAEEYRHQQRMLRILDKLGVWSAGAVVLTWVALAWAGASVWWSLIPIAVLLTVCALVPVYASRPQ